MPHAVISTIGHDRPGLVSDITAVAKTHNVNITDSRMTVLGGEFAVLMAIEGDDQSMQACRTALDELCSGADLAFVFRLTRPRQNSTNLQIYTATVAAVDHPGIVHSIAEFFSQRNINIRDLATETTPAAHTGTPIFNVTLVAEVDAESAGEDLPAAFAAFCADHDLDGTLLAG